MPPVTSAPALPRTGWPVVGHAWAVDHLEATLARDRMAHAYLLTGVHGIGKTTLALALAQRLECTAPGSFGPCGQCLACVKLQRRVHPDLRIVDGAPAGWKLDKDGPPPPRKNDRERRTIKIDQVRELTQWLVQTPFEGRWKIAILRRFEEANDEAANALLKTLEEPPQHALLILTAQNATGLLPTIVSRCQRMALRPLAGPAVEAALVEQWRTAPEQAALLARLARGRLGWAVRTLSDENILKERDAALDQLQTLLDEGRAERLARVVALSAAKETLPQILEEWLVWWRDVLLLAGAGPDSPAEARVTNADRLEALRLHARRYTFPQARQALRALRAAQRHLDQNVNPRLALDVLMLDLP